MTVPLTWLVEAAVAGKRSRTSWNDRLWHWERPPSDHEEAKIARAARIATGLVKGNAVLAAIGAEVLPQGSYYNNTNVRLEADMDLRVQLPTLMVRYEPGIVAVEADAALGYITIGDSLSEQATKVRDQLAADCRNAFGKENVEVGNKAVSVAGLDGSRADVDLVPAFHLRYVVATQGGNFNTLNGVGIKGLDGNETWNFPDQHHANGIAKRARTRHRFKRLVRSVKQLNYELCEIGAINRRLPSFAVECLVYLVEDNYFLVEEDDRFGRILRVMLRLRDILNDTGCENGAHEINGVKYLFHAKQAWSISDTRNFADAAIARLAA
nr:hypothetical protein [uncultured Sphingomonas sp.]